MKDLDFFLAIAQDFAAKTPVDARLLIACLDLTALNSNDDDAVIHVLCDAAAAHQVAAVCVAPAFVSLAQAQLRKRCQVATVANFPSGNESLSHVLATIDASLQAGATEIDVVVPYQAFLSDGDSVAMKEFVKACKALCGPSITLKAILESGAIADPLVLERLALSVLEGGADFLKTSTGKVPQGASLEAAAVLLGAIKAVGDPMRGFKASGGVKTYEQAKSYWLLAGLIMGETWPAPACFRFGASTLLTDLSARLSA